MANLLRVMENDSLHANIRLFIGKIILLRAERVFKPFASFFIAPLMRLCTSTLSHHDGLTYYLRDVCVMFLTSFRQEKPDLDNRALCSEFSTLVIKCVPSASRLVVRENIRLVQMLYQTWRERFPIDKRLIMALLKQAHKGDVSATARAIGLQLVSMLITFGKVAPHQPEDDRVVQEEDFYKTLLSCLDFNSSRVYITGAEVVGQVLAVMTDASPSYGAMREATRAKIDYMHQKKEYARMILCLEQICANAPDFADS